MFEAEGTEATVTNDIQETEGQVTEGTDTAGEEQDSASTVADLQDQGEAVETLAKKDEPKGGESAAQDGEQPVAAATPGAFTPTLKFKIQDTELEMDPRLKDVIKDAESEKVFRDLYTKAYGLEVVKPKFLEAKQLNQQYESAWAEKVTPVFQTLTKAQSALERGDMDTVLRELGIPEEKVFQHVANKLRYQEMTPEERARVDQERQLQARVMAGQETQAQLLQQQEHNLKLAADMRTMQLEMALGQGPYRDIAQAVDAKLGQGAFRNRVIRAGKAHALETREDLPLDKAIEVVAAEYRNLIQVEQAKPAKPAPTPQEKVMKVASKKPPVIPSISGRGTSPAKSEVSRISDLRKLSKQMAQVDLDE